MQSRLTLRAVLLAGGLLASAAPALAMGSVVLSPASYYPAYTATTLNYAATQGGIPVEVLGNPFEVSDAELARTITRTMTGSHFGPPVPFLTERPDDFRSPYRVVLLFDSYAGYTSLRLCSGDIESRSAQEGGVVRVHAAFCANEKPLTSLSGRVTGASGPDDPKFRKLIGQMTANLLPRRNPDRQSDNKFFDS